MGRDSVAYVDGQDIRGDEPGVFDGEEILGLRARGG
jgi:hypothetical protein